MNKIFINLIETKTHFDSFSSMLKENNYKNILNKIIPLDYIVRKIETLTVKFYNNHLIITNILYNFL